MYKAIKTIGPHKIGDVLTGLSKSQVKRLLALDAIEKVNSPTAEQKPDPKANAQGDINPAQ